MATAVYKGVPPSVSSSSFMEVAATMGDRRQGIGSILGFGSSSSLSSLRRTLSADMSSRTWRAQNQLLHSSSSSSSLSNLSMKEEEEEGESMIGEEEKEMGQSDIWNSILKKNKKEVDDPLLPPPYIHPLERRSSFGCLMSQKSLEICTESLGSETGTDCFTSLDEFDFDFFNSPPSSDAGDDEAAAAAHDEEEDESMTKLKRGRHQKKQRLMGSVNYHCSSMSKKSAPKSYPPPLPSISRRDGPCLHMRPHRVDGRLVVEAVPVPSQNYLHVQRENGRLVLSFIDIPTTFTRQRSSSSIHCDREVEAEVVGDENEEEEEEEIIEEHEHQQPDKSLVKMTKYGYADKDEEDESGVPEEEEEEEEEEEKEEAMEEDEEQDVEILVGVSVTTCRQPPQLQCSEKTTDMVVQRSPITTTTTNLVMTKILTRMPLSSHHPNKWMTRTPTTTTTPSKLDKKIASLVELEQEFPTQQHHHLLGKEVKVVGSQKASAAAGAYMNPYDCWWRRGSAHSSQIAAVMAAAHPKGHQQLAQLSPPEKLILTNSKLNPEDLMRHIRRCNQNRRPFLIWEPYCIATSS
ncbi:hypothetical protein QJS10_CPA05g00011 [Acorus calamus]|uniref:FAF domain-containing protein n=1 Tax=Acorus calamus TaxID=4465 RepID=A0AAV9EQQ4_ACOCL|nr:hypothetical protein QJS10_CPA05g00011 [Acorus calamus]